MATADLVDLQKIIKQRAPQLGPQFRPATSLLAGDDLETVVSSLFSTTKQRVAVRRVLDAWRAESKHQGSKLIAITIVDCDTKTVKLSGLRFVSEVGFAVSELLIPQGICLQCASFSG